MNQRLAYELESLGGALRVGLVSVESVAERLQVIVYERKFSEEKSTHDIILSHLIAEITKEEKRISNE